MLRPKGAPSGRVQEGWSSAGRVRQVEGSSGKDAPSEESLGKGCAGRVHRVLCGKSPRVKNPWEKGAQEGCTDVVEIDNKLTTNFLIALYAKYKFGMKTHENTHITYVHKELTWFGPKLGLHPPTREFHYK
jgi:hypothetical protein